MVRAVVTGLLTVVAGPVLMAACGGGGADVNSEQDELEIAAIAELAAKAYATTPEAIHDYLAEDVTAACSRLGLAEAAAAGHRLTGAVVRIENIRFEGNRASAVVTQITIWNEAGYETSSDVWTFVSIGDVWRIKQIPGLEECTN